MVVERELATEGKTRHDLGRDEFEERVWEWKASTAGGSSNPAGSGLVLRLDAASDSPWTRACPARFAPSSCRLYEEGLIYRDRYIVNWCPRCHTAISDLETDL